MNTGAYPRWRKEQGARIEGSRPLDRLKVQAPCAVRLSSGGYRLFYTAVGPAKPFPACQGYILSAVSDDGLQFTPEPGIRLGPRPQIPHISLRSLSPTVTSLDSGGWRMYFEARGSADRSTVICSAVSGDMLDWELEEGVRIEAFDGVGGPRFVRLPDGRGRVYCWASRRGARHPFHGVVSAVTSNGLDFTLEEGVRLGDRTGELDSAGITAADVIPPTSRGDRWTMYFSAWQDVPEGTVVPLHPSADAQAVESGRSDDFAAASIAADMAGYRSRIFVATSADGLAWERGPCVLEGAGYGGEGLDAVHAEDMSLVDSGGGRYRMYYAACDSRGTWRIASAVSA